MMVVDLVFALAVVALVAWVVALERAIIRLRRSGRSRETVYPIAKAAEARQHVAIAAVCVLALLRALVALGAGALYLARWAL